jgi:DNA-binding IclR family transcriptional regulator
LHEGIRFPLGVASAGLVILAHLSEREREAYLSGTDLTTAYRAHHGAGPLRERVAATRRRGYAVNPASSSRAAGAWAQRSSTPTTSRAGR